MVTCQGGQKPEDGLIEEVYALVDLLRHSDAALGERLPGQQRHCPHQPHLSKIPYWCFSCRDAATLHFST
jgi:hypothetical protein